MLFYLPLVQPGVLLSLKAAMNDPTATQVAVGFFNKNMEISVPLYTDARDVQNNFCFSDAYFMLLHAK